MAQILEATGRCVARYGVEGTTLERVASEAGLGRSLVRYFVGNRDDLLALYRQRLLDRYAAVPVEVVDGASALETLLATLLEEEPDLDDYAAIDAILAASRYDESLRSDVVAYYEGLAATIEAAVRLDRPRWGDVRVSATAYHVLATVYGHWTMRSLGLRPAGTTEVRTALLALLDEDT